jgi:hypothetical protein
MTNVLYDTDVAINIFRRRQNISYLGRYEDGNVGISYLESVPIFASTAVSLLDKSSSLVANRAEYVAEDIVLRDTSLCTFDTDQLWITDRIVTSTDGSSVPLFFQHIIDTDNVPRGVDYALQSNTTLSEVKILDKDFEEIFVEESDIDFDTGIVYNNLVNKADIQNGSYDVYYIQYSVRIDDDIFTYTEILNNTEIYSLATFDDLDDDLNIIQDGRKVYLVNNIDNQYEIVLPDFGDYGFRVKNSSKIQLEDFDNLDLSFPWYPNVLNGSFYAQVSGIVYRYYIAQFNSQSWNPESPYKKKVSEVSEYISPLLFKLNKENIYITSDYPLDIQIDDENGDGLIAFTTDSSLDGTTAANGATYYYWSFDDKIGVRSIDLLNGLIDVEGYDLDSPYKIYSTYYYEEKFFEFSDIDLNPVNNPDILEQRLILFIYPDDESTSKEQTLYYLLIDKRSRVIESDWEDFDNTTGLLDNGHELYYLSVPSFITPESGYEIFIDDYTVEGDGVFLVIGEMVVNPDSDVDDLTKMDVRVAGGGLKEDYVDAAKEKNSEVVWYWDLSKWDGQPYAGTASYFVEVPVGVLSGAGGTFTQQQVKNIVDKHTALGVYPIVRAYGVDVTITDVTPAPTSVTIEWATHGTDKYYNIYYAKDKAGPWTKANGSVVQDVGSDNSYTIYSLQSGVEYYIMIIGGTISDGVFTTLCGQPIGPYPDGARTRFSLNIGQVKTLSS